VKARFEVLQRGALLFLALLFISLQNLKKLPRHGIFSSIEDD
jgi:hypothetical protein